MSGQLLIDYVHNIGLSCNGIRGGWHIGWTTDEDKAMLAGQHGATVLRYTASDPVFSGWEVLFPLLTVMFGQRGEATEGVPS